MLRTSCYGDDQSGGILPVQNYPTLQLKGQGVLVGFMDSGIDYTSGLFRQLDGTTRIISIWDQTVQSGTPRKVSPMAVNLQKR